MRPTTRLAANPSLDQAPGLRAAIEREAAANPRGPSRGEGRPAP